MFGNSFVNYNGPGGVRRGHIWQSSRPAQRDYRGFWYNIFNDIDAQGSAGYSQHWKMIPEVVARRAIANPYPWPYATTIGTDPNTGDPFLTIVAYTNAEIIDIDYFYDPAAIDLPIDPNYPNYMHELFPDGSTKNMGLVKEVYNYPDTGATYETKGGCVMRIKGSFIHVDDYFSCHRYSGLQNVALPVKAMTDYYDNMLQSISYPGASAFNGCKYTIRPGIYYNMPMPEFDEAPNTQQSRIYANLYSSAPDPTTTTPYDLYAESRRTVYMDTQRDPNAQLYTPYQLFFSTAMDVYPTDEYSYRDYMDYPRTESEEDGKRRVYLSRVQSQPLFSVPFINFPYWIAGGSSIPAGHPYSCVIYPITGQYNVGNFASNSNYATLPATDKSRSESISGLFQFTTFNSNTANSIRCVNMFDTLNLKDLEYGISVANRSNRLTNILIPDVRANVFQPSITKGEKYLCNVSPSAATYRTSTTSQNDPEMWSGRYKFLGFKGTISFFEKR